MSKLKLMKIWKKRALKLIAILLLFSSLQPNASLALPPEAPVVPDLFSEYKIVLVRAMGIYIGVDVLVGLGGAFTPYLYDLTGSLPLQYLVEAGCLLGGVLAGNELGKFAAHTWFGASQGSSLAPFFLRGILATDSSAPSFLEENHFKEILMDRKVRAYALGSENIDADFESRVRDLSARLNDGFSDEEDCPICMVNWEGLRSTQQELIVSQGNCSCKYFVCPICSDELLKQRISCPSCRQFSGDHRLVFVIDDFQEPAESV